MYTYENHAMFYGMCMNRCIRMHIAHSAHSTQKNEILLIIHFNRDMEILRIRHFLRQASRKVLCNNSLGNKRFMHIYLQDSLQNIVIEFYIECNENFKIKGR